MSCRSDSCDQHAVHGHGHGEGYRESHHKGHKPHGGNCCHDSSSFFTRRFTSPEEEKEILEKYKSDLRKELEGVDARLKELTL